MLICMECWFQNHREVCRQLTRSPGSGRFVFLFPWIFIRDPYSISTWNKLLNILECSVFFSVIFWLTKISKMAKVDAWFFSCLKRWKPIEIPKIPENFVREVCREWKILYFLLLKFLDRTKTPGDILLRVCISIEQLGRSKIFLTFFSVILLLNGKYT